MTFNCQVFRSPSSSVHHHFQLPAVKLSGALYIHYNNKLLQGKSLGPGSWPQTPRHNELRPDLFEKILVLASDAVGKPQEPMNVYHRNPAGVGQLVHPEKNGGVLAKGKLIPKMAEKLNSGIKDLFHKLPSCL